MLAALGRCHSTACRAGQHSSTPRPASRARVWQGAPFPTTTAAAGACGRRRRRQRAGGVVRAQKQEEQDHGAGVQDLYFPRVARDLKTRLAQVASGKHGSMDRLQDWLSQADLRQRGESDVEEHSQAEVVAEEEASHLGLEGFQLNLQAWLDSSPEEGGSDLDAKMAGAVVMRLMQAYHKEAGEPFDDEQEDAYWRLQGFMPGSLVEVVDHDLLKRLVKGYLSLPFSGA